MRTVNVFRLLLGLQSPWLVNRVDISPEEKRIDVWISHRKGARFLCPLCGLELSIVDHVASRTWRHFQRSSDRLSRQPLTLR
jgi:transposase